MEEFEHTKLNQQTEQQTTNQLFDQIQKTNGDLQHNNDSQATGGYYGQQNQASEFTNYLNRNEMSTFSCSSNVSSLQNSSVNNEKCVPNLMNKLKHELHMNAMPEQYKRCKVDLYTDNTGPKFYPVKGNNVTPALITQNLTEAFKFLPIFGRPKAKVNLDEFLKNKVKEFVGGGLNDKEFEQLSRNCCPEILKTGKEVSLPVCVPANGLLPSELQDDSDDSSNELCVVKKHKIRLSIDKKCLFQKKLKYRGLRLIPAPQEEELTESKEPPLEPGKDLVFHVRFYRPFPHNPLENQLRSRHSLFTCDMVVLGRQRLSVLRDRIACPNDVSMRVDVSHTPDHLPPTTSKEVFPSGFLFINNVFYVDTREGCSDLSEPVRKWCVRRGLGLFPHRDMSLRLDQLPIKLGHPDVYIHQGNCEHLFTFSDVRLLNASDPLNASQYPYHTSVAQNQTIYCTTCAEFGAKWIVTGCAKVPFDPAFFCDTCFKMYLYKDKEKIGDFKAYSYRGNEINILRPQGQQLGMGPFGTLSTSSVDK